MLNLDPKYANLLKKILKTHVPGKIIWIYGSRINGSSHAGSDVDMVIKDPKGRSLSEKNLARLREAIEESSLPILVDVLDWAMLPETFQEEINRQHVVFLSNKKST